MSFDINDPDQLPDADWFSNPPDWFVYFVTRLTPYVGPEEVADALEKVSPWGQAPDCATAREVSK